MQDLSDGVFINVANLTLACRDSYLEYIHLSALFPDHIIAKAEEEIRHHDDKHNSGPSQRKPQCFHPYSQPSRQQQEMDHKSPPPPPPPPPPPQHGSRLEGIVRDLPGPRLLLFLSDQPRHRSSFNDNYCVSCVAGSLVNVFVTGKETCFVNGVTRNKSCVKLM